MTRGILSSCTSARRRPVTQAELDALYAAAYADEPFVTVVPTPPATKHVTGSNEVRIHVRLDERTGRILVHRRRGQPRQGRRRPGDPGLQPRPRPARDDRSRTAPARAMTATRPYPRSRSRRPTLPPVERRAAMPAGFRAGGLAAGIKASGRPDLAIAVTTAGPAAAAAVFTPNTFAAAPVRLSQANLAATSGDPRGRFGWAERRRLDQRLRECRDGRGR